MRSCLALRAGIAEVRGFETAARNLAGDATGVGLAIRWLEIQSDTRLPAWPGLLRSVASHVFVLDERRNAAIWFG